MTLLLAAKIAAAVGLGLYPISAVLIIYADFRGFLSKEGAGASMVSGAWAIITLVFGSLAGGLWAIGEIFT